jgi:EmrB/QacA subfamily drug resistance transporter
MTSLSSGTGPHPPAGQSSARPGPPAGAPSESADQRSSNPNLALTVLALTGLMLVLDITITNVALPTIQQALDTSTQDLQWVVNAYALAAGGFLLLGGRLADRLGRRRVFLAGMGLFALGSLAGGLAPSAGWLIAARGLQGLGAAISGPAAFSIITTTFAEGHERNRAVGVWSATAAAGGALGMLLGGLLTQYVGWRWVLFVNVPVAALVLAATPRLVPDLPGEPAARTDVAGAVTVTGGLLALVYATTQVPEHGWTAAPTLGLLVLAGLLLTAFVVIEARHRAPLVPLGIFRRRSLTGATTVGLLVGAGLTATPIFFVTLYLQQILGFSAIAAGLASLPLALGVIAAAQLATRLIGNFGARRLAAAGLLLSGAALLLLGRIHPDGGYAADVLGPMLAQGLGMGLVFMPVMVSAVAGVPPADQGLVSGLLQTTQQLGVALGMAALTTLATATTTDLLAGAGSPADPATVRAALTSGYAAALRGAALVALAAAALAVLLLPSSTRPAPTRSPTPPPHAPGRPA